jgi:hypothetical protein
MYVISRQETPTVVLHTTPSTPPTLTPRSPIRGAISCLMPTANNTTSYADGLVSLSVSLSLSLSLSRARALSLSLSLSLSFARFLYECQRHGMERRRSTRRLSCPLYMYLCTYVCMYIRMYVRMYECVYVQYTDSIYIAYIHTAYTHAPRVQSCPLLLWRRYAATGTQS